MIGLMPMEVAIILMVKGEMITSMLLRLVTGYMAEMAMTQ